MDPVKVFISYSHDSAEHSARVLALADKLREMGVDVELDRYHVRPPKGWPHWCADQLKPEKSRFVLVICTAAFLARVEGKVPADEGRGVYWEGSLIYDYIYDAKGNERFIPLLLGEEPESSLPQGLKNTTSYRLRDFAFEDEGFDALYCELTEQLKMEKRPLGEVVQRKSPQFAPVVESPVVSKPLPELPVRSNFAPIDISRIDSYAPTDLIGREDETAVIADAWAKAARGEPHPRVLTFVALGGEGKTALVARWAADFVAAEAREIDAAFAWSFYSQGVREQAGASSDLFLAAALAFFGGELKPGESSYDKGKRLGEIVGSRRALLVLDGLEPLQYAPGPPMNGALKDDGVRALLKTLAQRNAGLALVTTRYRVKDLDAYAQSAPQRELAPLNEGDGAKLLTKLGVKGTPAEKQALSRDARGHALTLTLVGTYLRDAHGGDIRRRDLFKLDEADAEEGNGHAFRVMKAYERLFASEGDKGARALAMLRLLGLFDRPADAGCLEALWSGPAIANLTEPLIAASEAQRTLALKRLADAKLVTVERDGANALVQVDAHPLLREYFAKRLREADLAAFQAGHKRLYEHLTATTKDEAEPTLAQLQPLYEAVAHGCWAGMQQEACAKVYRDRIRRGGEAYSTNKLGAFGADLGAVACFFDEPWRRPSAKLTPADRAWLLSQAAFRLRALGRLAEAREPMRAGLEMYVAQENSKAAAIGASNLSELELTLGEVGAALADGEASVAHADRSGDAFQRLSKRTTHADALHQAGRRAEAAARFAEAEAMQAEDQPEYPRLYSLRGFQFGDVLLAEAERAAWRRAAGGRGDAGREATEAGQAAYRDAAERATQTLGWAQRQGFLLDIGLDHLTLARAALYAAALRGEPPPAAHGNAAVDFLRRAGTQDHLPRALLTRALAHSLAKNFAAARAALDEALEIAERGPMRLHLADVYLHRARIFGLFPGRPEEYPWPASSARADLAAAKRLIDACGYGRRQGELEDAEAAFARREGREGPPTPVGRWAGGEGFQVG